MTVDGLSSASDVAESGDLIAVVTSPGKSTTATLSYSEFHGLSISTIVGGVEVARIVDVGLQADAHLYRIDPHYPVVQLGCVEIEDSFDLPTGKARRAHLRASRASYVIGHDTAARLVLELLVADDGVAHRLRLESTDPAHDGPVIEILEEVGQVCLPAGSRCWLQDHDRVGQVTPGYEGWHCDGTTVDELPPSDAGWTMPALFEVDGQWLLLTETDVDAISGGSHFNLGSLERSFAIRRPHPDEGNPEHTTTVKGSLPIVMPWRVNIVGALVDVVESNLVRHLPVPADPAKDFTWVRPGRVAWTWWADHDSPRNPDALRSAVDAASAFGWEFVLVDANWNHLPAGSVEALVEYGEARNVGIMLWYNSGGPNNYMNEEPRDLMTDPEVRQAELRRIADLGIKGIKVDFFHTDKPDGIAQFQGILRDAANVELMVNFHGCTAPRGWSRTFPNLMTTEAVRGAEWYRLSDDYGPRAPVNNTILPFTRNVVGSMDYTPVVLSDLGRARITTNAHELALAVVFESGLLHFCDSPDGYLGQTEPVRRFLQVVPAVWDETRLLSGRPGDHAVVARRHGSSWFIAGINGRATPSTPELDAWRLDALSADRVFEVLFDCSDGQRQLTHGRMSASQLLESPPEMAPHGGWVAWSTE